MQLIERIREFDGWLQRYTHDAATCRCPMTFSVYLPPQSERRAVPALYYLSGLTCTDDNVRVKAGAQRYAAELGLALVMPDTSPRGADVPDAPERYDLGQGAGFYVDATRAPWSMHYRMYSYITRELPALVEQTLPLLADRRAITGHSMGGHGALICALKNPGRYRSVSAFAPVCNPVNSGWGQGCLGTYLGDERADWQAWDATELILAGAAGATSGANTGASPDRAPIPMLIDQGTADEFLADGQLRPEALARACDARGVPLTLRMQPDYDHSYHFIASFIGEHLAWHAQYLA